jgi:hypothetical protein
MLPYVAHDVIPSLISQVNSYKYAVCYSHMIPHHCEPACFLCQTQDLPKKPGLVGMNTPGFDIERKFIAEFRLPSAGRQA